MTMDDRGSNPCHRSQRFQRGAPRPCGYAGDVNERGDGKNLDNA